MSLTTDSATVPLPRATANPDRSPARVVAALIASGRYVGAIVLANWMFGHVCAPGPGGAHFAPVGFGLMASTGVYAAAIAFPARDIVQRSPGRLVGSAAIVIGAAISWFVSSPTLAIASGLTFLVSEAVDFGIFATLWRRGLVRVVIASSLAALVVDSCLFLSLVGIPWSLALMGQVVGKTWVILASGPIVYALRRVPSLQFTAPV